MTSDLGSGYAANALWWLTGVATLKCWQYARMTSRRRFWTSLATKGVVKVFITTYAPTEATSTPRTSAPEVDAYGILTSLLGRHGLRAELHEDTEGLGGLAGCGGIVLGGPRRNVVARDLWTRYGPQLAAPYQIDTEAQNIARIGSPPFAPTLGSDNPEDFGLLLYRKNPLCDSHWLLIAAGCHGYGTCGAVALLEDNRFLQRVARYAGHGEFSAIARAVVVNGRVRSAKLHEPATIREG